LHSILGDGRLRDVPHQLLPRLKRRKPRARKLAALSLALVSLALTAFGPPPDAVRAQVAYVPGVGIEIATLDSGRSEVRSYGAKLDADSAFEIGSVTKTFTATLFADMIGRHEVAPDDPIERYLPAGATAPTFEDRHITLADLATQSSGLPRMPANLSPANPDDPYVDYDDAKLLAFLSSYKLTRAPGATFEYSNLGFGLLGYLLARRLGVDYATAIRTRILEPLGMSHTLVATGARIVKTSGGHDADGDPVPHWSFAALAGAGAIVSTPNDMLRYARANLESAGPLGAATILAQQPRGDAGGGGRRLGYAWVNDPDGIVWHNGGTAGFRTFLGLDRAHDRAIVVFANGSLDAVDALGFHALDNKRPLPVAPVADAVVAPAILERYVGRYRFSDKSIATVSRDARGLSIAFDQPLFRARLHPSSNDAFTVRSPHIDVRFDDAGTGLKLIVAQAGEPPDTGERLP
jgi:serine-type D-Ala-D-Ala carboxypeptidase/endopeptidase